MTTQINMPRLSDSMEEGVVLAWLIEPGQPVAVGEDLVEIETDKATMTYQSEVEGVLAILADEGDTVAVGDPIARVGAPGETPAPAAEPTTPSSARAGSSSDGANSDPSPAPAVTTAEAPQSPALASASDSDSDGNGVRVGATPLARRMARELGLTLADLSGSGPRGRVTKADVLAAGGRPPEPPRQTAVPRVAAPAATAPTPAADGGAKGTGTIQELTRLQQTIARRMSEVKATVPDFQVETEVEMDAAIDLRKRLKKLAGERPAPSFNDLVVKACAVALRDHPRANGSYRAEGFELHSQINVGIAVAADDALVVPTITDADKRSLGDIARESRRLAERVRSGEVTPPELAGGTFTVSNLGMFGMTSMTPVINLHQAAILGVGSMREVLKRVDGEVVDRTLMTLRMSCDHRILYGADAARFLADVKALLENPLSVAL